MSCSQASFNARYTSVFGDQYLAGINSFEPFNSIFAPNICRMWDMSMPIQRCENFSHFYNLCSQLVQLQVVEYRRRTCKLPVEYSS